MPKQLRFFRACNFGVTSSEKNTTNNRNLNRKLNCLKSSYCLKLLFFADAAPSELQSIENNCAFALFFTAKMEERQNEQITNWLRKGLPTKGLSAAVAQ